MFVLLFVLWLVFNGRCSLDVVAVGLVLSAVITWFAVRFCRWDVTREWNWVKFVPAMLAYSVLLVKEILLANLAVIRLILDPKMEEKVRPQLVKFPVTLKSPFSRMLFANSITLTPGTITVRAHSDSFVVHALTPEMGTDIDKSSFAEGCARIDAIVSASKKEDSHVS